MSDTPYTFREQVLLQDHSDQDFTSTYNPGRMGNLNNIAYGGCTIAVGINPAYQTLKVGYHVFSILGNYLGPALVDRNFQVKVTPVRYTNPLPPV